MSKKAKGTPPTDEQSRILRAEGYDPHLCEVIRDTKFSMIVHDLETERTELIDKSKVRK